VNEDFLHYIWKRLQFNLQEPQTIDGESIEIIDVGFHNPNAGPDFLNSRVRIGQTLWAGNVEIHLSSSDWYKHNHEKDLAYENVILHVVFTNDRDVFRKDGSKIPTFELKERIDYHSYRKYKAWLQSGSYIPCDKLLEEVPKFIKSSAVQAAAIQRLQNKSSSSREHLLQSKGDLEESFYRLLMRAMGMKVNALPFEQLSKITPYEIVRKIGHSQKDLESVLLGQAGFLVSDLPKEPYTDLLKEKYSFFRSKYTLHPMPKTAWKLSRLRPQNFPQIRIVQLAKFYSTHQSVAQRISELTRIGDFEELFSTKIDKGFWLNHYTIEKESAARVKSFGKDFLNHILINAVVPFVFSLAEYNRDDGYKQRAIDILESLTCEKNAIIRKFEALGFPSESSLDSQGIIELKHALCDKYKCLKCKVGNYIMNNHGATS